MAEENGKSAGSEAYDSGYVIEPGCVVTCKLTKIDKTRMVNGGLIKLDIPGAYTLPKEVISYSMFFVTKVIEEEDGGLSGMVGRILNPHPELKMGDEAEITFGKPIVLNKVEYRYSWPTLYKSASETDESRLLVAIQEEREGVPGRVLTYFAQKSAPQLWVASEEKAEELSTLDKVLDKVLRKLRIRRKS